MNAGIGSVLRRERLTQKLTIDVIHSRTRIAPRFLEAIEENDFERLPGLIFTRNFVRQYSEALGLDSTELLAAIPLVEESALKLPDPPTVPKARQWTLGHASALASIAWLFMAILAGVAGYLYFNHGRLAHAADPVTAVGTKPERKPEPELATAVQPAKPAVDQPQVDGSHANKMNSVQVVVSASQRSWVSLTADGKSAFVGTMAPNETKEISALEQVKLVTGNAGGLKVSLNGKALDPLGPTGQVRIVKLTAEGPEFLSKAPAPSVDDAL